MFMKRLLAFGIWLFCLEQGYSQEAFNFYFGKEIPLNSLLGGKNISSSQPVKWINVNTHKNTWEVRGELLVDFGDPVGVVRTEKQYENFILHVEWKHLTPGGNSGVFAWSDGKAQDGSPYPSGVEIQMLDSQWVILNKRNGLYPPVAYVHGEMWGVGNVKTKPDNPRGNRSKSIENRAVGTGKWNTYDVVCIDGVIKLSVNGKFVNGISHATTKRGYLCLESEGGEIHFRNFQLIELPPGVTYPEQGVPVLNP